MPVKVPQTSLKTFQSLIGNVHRNRARRYLWLLLVALILTFGGFGLAYRPAHAATTWIVNSLADSLGACPSVNNCTLRQAIINANGDSGDTITFNIAGAGVQTIVLTGPLPSIIAPVAIDGTTQPLASCAPAFNLLIELQGPSITGAAGLDFAAGSQNSVVKGLVMDNFGNNAIALANSGNNTIICNFIGTNPAGTAAGPGNGLAGVNIGSGTGNVIGGTVVADRNVISGNVGQGVGILNAGTTNNVVEGNYIGTNATGTAVISNGTGGVDIFSGAQNNTVGGITPGAANVIAGVGQAISLDGAGTTGNKVVGNLIGIDPTGSVSLGSPGAGVAVTNGASNNVIGGTTVAERNVISGNGGAGVAIISAGTSNNIIEGNYIGVNAAGTAAVGNNTGVLVLAGASNNTIGGISVGARNVIAGSNPGADININGAGTNANVVEGNYIGVDATGTVPMPVGPAAADISINNGASNNVIGSPGAGNVIASSPLRGISIHDPGTTGNIVQANFVGTNAAGTAAIPNAMGIYVFNGATNNTIGGAAAGAGNIISGNTQNGLQISDPGTTGNTVFGNTIGMNASKSGADIPTQVQKAGQRDTANHRPLRDAVSWTHLGLVIGLGWPMRSVKQGR